MLLYLLRNARVLLRAQGTPRVALNDESVIVERVRLTDLDYNLHMNNARYLEAFEMGRLDQIARSGVLQLMLNDKLMPVVGSIDVRFMHQMRYGQRFAVHSRLDGWDDRWFFLSQSMTTVHDGKLAATAFVRAAFLRKNRIVVPTEILTQLGIEAEARRMPEAIQAFETAENNIHKLLRQHTHYDPHAHQHQHGAGAGKHKH